MGAAGHLKLLSIPFHYASQHVLVTRTTCVQFNDKMMPAAVERVYINTGNLLASEAFKRKVILVPSGEVLEGLQLTLTHWRQQEGNGVIKNESDKESTDLVIRNAHLPSRVSTEETNRDGIKVSVKLFAYNESCKVFTNAINFVMDELAIDVIDSLTLSLPPSLTKGSIELIKPIWSCAVKNVRLGKVKDVGVSDLNTDQLKELYTWAEEIKPSTNQINLDACCVIPPEMNEFAQSKDIRLLTHNDPRDFVPLDKLQTLLGEAGFENPEAWQRLWVARYTVMVTGKGIIQTKGYILGLVKAGE